MVSCVSRENEKAAVKLVIYFTQMVWFSGGASWSRARSPFISAKRYQKTAKRSQCARKEAEKANIIQRQRMSSSSPQMSRRYDSPCPWIPTAFMVLCPSLVTSRWEQELSKVHLGDLLWESSSRSVLTCSTTEKEALMSIASTWKKIQY